MFDILEEHPLRMLNLYPKKILFVEISTMPKALLYLNLAFQNDR